MKKNILRNLKPWIQRCWAGKQNRHKNKRFEKPESHRHYFKNRQYFQREVTFDGRISKTLYNLNFNGMQYTDLTIAVEPYRITSILPNW